MKGVKEEIKENGKKNMGVKEEKEVNVEKN